MIVVAEFTFEADAFLLGRIVRGEPDVSVELERVVPTDARVMPYLWGHGKGLDRFAAALRAHQHVQSVTTVDCLEDRALYRIDWESDTRQLITGIADLDATIMEAYSDDRWTFRIRFENRSGLAEFRQYCTDRGVDYRLERVSQLDDLRWPDRIHGLTEPQYEVLVLALERGYFEVPRRSTLTDLADELDITVQAVSERVRRGTNVVFESVLADHPSPRG